MRGAENVELTVLCLIHQKRLRAKARHDETQALYNARKERNIEIAKKLLKRNRPIDEIVEDAGLTYEEVENLRIKN